MAQVEWTIHSPGAAWVVGRRHPSAMSAHIGPKELDQFRDGETDRVHTFSAHKEPVKDLNARSVKESTSGP